MRSEQIIPSIHSWKKLGVEPRLPRIWFQHARRWPGSKSGCSSWVFSWKIVQSTSVFSNTLTNIQSRGQDELCSPIVHLWLLPSVQFLTLCAIFELCPAAQENFGTDVLQGLHAVEPFSVAELPRSVSAVFLMFLIQSLAALTRSQQEFAETFAWRRACKWAVVEACCWRKSRGVETCKNKIIVHHCTCLKKVENGIICLIMFASNHGTSRYYSRFWLRVSAKLQ